MSAFSTLPHVPVKHKDFIPYLVSNFPKPLIELLEPFKQYDAKLREVFAQEPGHLALADPHLNVVPVFNGHEKDVKIHARDLRTESVEEKEKYIMPLKSRDRRPTGSPAIVQDLKTFETNFALFSESALVDLDWSNVVAAGSSVVTCLLPVPKKYAQSKKTLRQLYHQMIAPASDVDLFLYGLSEEEAIKKIIQIEQCIKESILTETTTIRTKNAITIVSKYPTRHIQIVLRVYKSIAEILTGFDVDCSCVAYDGKQVYAAPRALTAFMAQRNTIDLTRRSPSYENRLSKYSHRGFEVYWPLLERSRIDPTIYERHFARTVGLARLLVLERLPTKSERESYMDQRRKERGRPPVSRPRFKADENDIKLQHEDEVAEWVGQDDISDYHTFSIPYGPKYSAKRIERLLYAKDLLLNAEWNKSKDREVNLHRHPAFFGNATDVIEDCCGSCPAPLTPEEHEIAEKEAKIYVSGKISFIKDDPGRQAIGSFNPLTDDDWTEMAYVGNSARLFQAIVDEDAQQVEDWLADDGSDPNIRDYTGRTPLHLAVMSSTPEIVGLLISHGARLIARLADGRTALHLAAARGNADMVRMILQKSEENEEEESKRDGNFRRARAEALKAQSSDEGKNDGQFESDDSDLEEVDSDASDIDVRTATTGSYVKVGKNDGTAADIIPEDGDEPDIYDVNVLSWDTQCSPLHYAILGGHTEVVKVLVQDFGADVLLPAKLLKKGTKKPRGAILTLVLALQLPLEEAKVMIQALLELGASCIQADARKYTAFRIIADKEPRLIKTLLEYDPVAAKRAIDHCLVPSGGYKMGVSPLLSAIYKRDAQAALILLEAGAAHTITYDHWLQTLKEQSPDSLRWLKEEDYREEYLEDQHQPLVIAVERELPEIIPALLERGADPNVLPGYPTRKGITDERVRKERADDMHTVLDWVRKRMQDLRNYTDRDGPSMSKRNERIKEGTNYLEGLKPGTYKEFMAKSQVDSVRRNDELHNRTYERLLREHKESTGFLEKKKAMQKLMDDYLIAEQELLRRGAKTLREMFPETEWQEASIKKRPTREPSPVQPFSDHHSFSLTGGYFDQLDNTDLYLALFQAAWDGDLGKIKTLTLTPQGSEGVPLRVAARDSTGFNSYNIAVLRGHRDAARAVLEIAFAQYEPETDKSEVRYRIREETDSDHGLGMDDVELYKEIVDDNLTIEDIGKIATQAKCVISPLDLLEGEFDPGDYHQFCEEDRTFTYGVDEKKIYSRWRHNLMAWAVVKDDLELFRFVADLHLEWTARMVDSQEATAKLAKFYEEVFKRAVVFGRLDLLEEMLRRFGAGLDLEALVKRSGVKLVEKKQYYEGLSVHGKKRADWVASARGLQQDRVKLQNPPLLYAAFKGSLASVEWYLTDAPARLYTEFADAHREHKLIKHLDTSAGGFEKVLGQWLDTSREYALHIAIMAEPGTETTNLIRYLIDRMPDSLNLPSRYYRYTPLLVAFSVRHYEAAKLLIEAGADQTARDAWGNNIVHLLLISQKRHGSTAIKEEHLQRHLDLVDKTLVRSLLTQRSYYVDGFYTPLARWFGKVQEGYAETYNKPEILRIMLDFARLIDNEDLDVLDGAGQTPLHFVAQHDNLGYMLDIMLEYRPDLAHRENSTGRTPLEIAEEVAIAKYVKDPPDVEIMESWYQRAVLDTAPYHFVPKSDEPRRTMKKIPGKRRLVSLLDASEVANRLANRHGRKRPGFSLADDDDDDAEKEVTGGSVDRKMDEVDPWFKKGLGNHGYY